MMRSGAFAVSLSLFMCMTATQAVTNTAANETLQLPLPHKKFLRFIDTKEEYGKSCEEYSYITPVERYSLLKKEFPFAEILTDALSIEKVPDEYLVETNRSDCQVEDMHISEYRYEEKVEYLSEGIISMHIYRYAYGAGAAHGNGDSTHIVYDREYGMRLDWKALFGENEAIDRYIFERVKKEVANEAYLQYFDAYDQLFNFRKEGYFAITEAGLLIQFGKYEITPGSEGLPLLIVPKEVLKEYMDNAMYEKCFGNDKHYMVEAENEKL